MRKITLAILAVSFIIISVFTSCNNEVVDPPLPSPLIPSKYTFSFTMNDTVYNVMASKFSSAIRKDKEEGLITRLKGVTSDSTIITLNFVPSAILRGIGGTNPNSISIIKANDTIIFNEGEIRVMDVEWVLDTNPVNVADRQTDKVSGFFNATGINKRDNKRVIITDGVFAKIPVVLPNDNQWPRN
jgi:hypothetical protein